MDERERGDAARPMTRRERRLMAERGGPRILTVCTGNICRSPLAEAILRARLSDLGVAVSSAGTHAMVGHEMTSQSQRLAVQRGADAADTEAHRARYLVDPMLLEADLVLAMAREHRAEAAQLTPARRHHMLTIREFARLAAGLDDDTIRAAADAAGDVPGPRFAAAVLAIAAERSGSGSDDDDVIDPYHRSDATYERSANEIDPGIAQVERVARLALA